MQFHCQLLVEVITHPSPKQMHILSLAFNLMFKKRIYMYSITYTIWALMVVAHLAMANFHLVITLQKESQKNFVVFNVSLDNQIES